MTERSDHPLAERPAIADPAYGVPRDRKGLLPRTHVAERMGQARVYRVSTVDPRRQPHATPLDGSWRDNTLYFRRQPGGPPQP